MMDYMIIGTLVAVLIIGLLVLVFYKRGITEAENKRTGKYPEGHYMGMGIALGVPLGLPFGLAIGNIALGPAFGVAIGAAIGSYLENKHKGELRPLTEEEKERKKRIMYLLLGVMLLGALAFLLVAYAPSF